MMGSSGGSDMDCTSPQIDEEAYELDMLPKKSKRKYEKEYKYFVKWCGKNKLGPCYAENVLFAYVSKLSKTRKPAMVWSIYSMLRTTLAAHHNVDISEYNQLITFLKKYSKDYKPIKPKVLNKAEIDRFLLDAPDERHLMSKVALVFGVCGACNGEELASMTVDDIQDNGSILVVKVGNTKPDEVPRTFVVSNSTKQKPDYSSFYRKYLALRPSHVSTRRLFLKFWDGKCATRVVGMNAIGKIPKRIADFLNLPDSDSYTCFRRNWASFSEDADGQEDT